MLLKDVLAHHHRVDQHPGHRDLLGLDGAVFHHLLHLGDHLAAPPLGGHHRRQDLQHHALLLGGQVPVLIAVGAPDHQGVDGDGLVLDVLLPVHLHDGHQLVAAVLGPLVHLAPLDPGVHIGAQAHLAQLPRLPEGHAVVHIGHLPLGQVERLDLVPGDQVHHHGGLAPVAADDPLEQALMGQMGHAAGHLHGRLAAGVDEGQIPGVALLQEPPLDLLQDGLAGGDQRHADGAEGGAVLDQIHRLFRADECWFSHSRAAFLPPVAAGIFLSRRGREFQTFLKLPSFQNVPIS